MFAVYHGLANTFTGSVRNHVETHDSQAEVNHAKNHGEEDRKRKRRFDERCPTAAPAVLSSVDHGMALNRQRIPRI